MEVQGTYLPRANMSGRGDSAGVPVHGYLCPPGLVPTPAVPHSLCSVTLASHKSPIPHPEQNETLFSIKIL